MVGPIGPTGHPEVTRHPGDWRGHETVIGTGGRRRFRVASDVCPYRPRSSFSITYSADDGTDDFRGRAHLPDEACLAILEEPARVID